MEDRHAYLIMAHNDFEALHYLMHALDDARNDIYLHIDKKAKDVNFDEIRSWLHKARLYFTPRINVIWGHISQVKCEIILLREATKRAHYHYYHLLSGSDFPIKSQDFIHEFLRDKDSEYLDYHHSGYKGDDFLYKIRYYHLLMRWIGRGEFNGPSKRDRFIRNLTIWEAKIIEKQQKAGIDRTKKHKNIDFVKGGNWFSITDDFARFLVRNSKKILRDYRFVNGPDEIFLPTVAINSPFKNRVCNNNLREIDWDRGQPYEYVFADLNELKGSDRLFARKISYTREPDLVGALMKYIGVD